MARRLLSRLPRTLALAILLGWLAYTLASWFLVWNPADAGAYYDAATRLTRGEPLYPSVHPEAHEVYRYAPWFAVAWIPLTALPRETALHLWSLAMLACAGAAVWPLLRRPTWTSVSLAALVGQTLVETAMFGNAHPLVVAALVWTVGWRTFPVWVGVAASIKLVPLALVIVWATRRQWRPSVVATGMAAILSAPMLLFDLRSYVTDPGTGLLSLYAISPQLWAVTAIAATFGTAVLAIRRSPYAWVAAAALMFVGPPRVVLSYLAFLPVGYELASRERAGVQEADQESAGTRSGSSTSVVSSGRSSAGPMK